MRENKIMDRERLYVHRLGTGKRLFIRFHSSVAQEVMEMQ
jgi:hypothetical protein